jgi:hypothetical protein
MRPRTTWASGHGPRIGDAITQILDALEGALGRRPATIAAASSIAA